MNELMEAVLIILLVLLTAALVILARYVLQRKQVLKRIRTQLAVTRVLSEACTLEEAAPRILQAVAGITGWQIAAMHVVDTTGQSLRCIDTWLTPGLAPSPLSEDTRQMVFAKGVGLPGRIWKEKQFVWIGDLSKETNFPRAAVANESGMNSGCGFPLPANEKVVGIIEGFGKTLKRPEPALEEMLLALGSQIGQFIERRSIEFKINSSEAQIRAIVDTAADGIITVNDRGEIETVNRAATRIFGYSAEEVIGKNVVIFLPVQQQQKYGPALKLYFRTTIDRLIGRVTEVSGQRKDGTTFPMELAVSLLSVDGREIFTGIMRDITDRKQVEKRVSEFYSMVSHELRSPLASIRGSLGLMEGGVIGELPADMAELVQIARNNCDRLIRLINDILDVKKIEAGKLEIKRRELTPHELIFAAVDGMRSFAAEAKVSLVAQVDDNAPDVLGDSDRIVQVLTNLLSNAIKFSPEGEQVEVDVGPAINGDKFLRFSVRDRGPGIPADELSKLFSNFQQIDSSDSRPIAGTGLGLSISKAIVESHEGQIGVDNTPGTGATFWFELPTVGRGADKRSAEASYEASRALQSEVENQVNVTEIARLSSDHRD